MKWLRFGFYLVVWYGGARITYDAWVGLATADWIVRGGATTACVMALVNSVDGCLDRLLADPDDLATKPGAMPQEIAPNIFCVKINNND